MSAPGLGTKLCLQYPFHLKAKASWVFLLISADAELSSCPPRNRRRRPWGVEPTGWWNLSSLTLALPYCLLTEEERGEGDKQKVIARLVNCFSFISCGLLPHTPSASVKFAIPNSSSLFVGFVPLDSSQHVKIITISGRGWLPQRQWNRNSSWRRVWGFLNLF